MNKIENKHGIAWVNEDGIFMSVFKPDLTITLAIAEELVQNRLKLSNGVSLPGLTDIRNLSKVENQATDYLASEEAHELVSATAILTYTPIQNLIANFYLKFKNSICPTKLFTDKDQALRWLALYANKQLN